LQFKEINRRKGSRHFLFAQQTQQTNIERSKTRPLKTGIIEPKKPMLKAIMRFEEMVDGTGVVDIIGAAVVVAIRFPKINKKLPVSSINSTKVAASSRIQITA
jgi:hypothetical protein